MPIMWWIFDRKLITRGDLIHHLNVWMWIMLRWQLMWRLILKIVRRQWPKKSKYWKKVEETRCKRNLNGIESISDNNIYYYSSGSDDFDSHTVAARKRLTHTNARKVAWHYESSIFCESQVHTCFHRHSFSSSSTSIWENSRSLGNQQHHYTDTHLV